MCSRSRENQPRAGDGGRHSWACCSKQDLRSEGDNPRTLFYRRLRGLAATILRYRVPRDRVPGCEWGATDYRNPVGDGDEPEGLTSGASVFQEQKPRLVGKLALEDMGEREAGSTTHPREHDSRRSRIPLVSPRASDQRDLGVNIPPSAESGIGASRSMTQKVWDRRSFGGEEVEGAGSAKGSVW